MATITELRQKRAALWEKTKKFLDDAKRENDMLSADDVATYEKMEAEIVALGKEKDRQSLTRSLTRLWTHLFSVIPTAERTRKQAEQVMRISRRSGN